MYQRKHIFTVEFVFMVHGRSYGHCSEPYSRMLLVPSVQSVFMTILNFCSEETTADNIEILWVKI